MPSNQYFGEFNFYLEMIFSEKVLGQLDFGINAICPNFLKYC